MELLAEGEVIINYNVTKVNKIITDIEIFRSLRINFVLLKWTKQTQVILSIDVITSLR